MNELRWSLGARGTPAWRLSTALTTSVQRGVPSGLEWLTAARRRGRHRAQRRRAWPPRGEPRLRRPGPQERARRGGHGGGARAEEGRGLVRVGRAQVELKAVGGRDGLEGDVQLLELSRHTRADAVAGGTTVSHLSSAASKSRVRAPGPPSSLRSSYWLVARAHGP